MKILVHVATVKEMEVDDKFEVLGINHPDHDTLQDRNPQAFDNLFNELISMTERLYGAEPTIPTTYRAEQTYVYAINSANYGCMAEKR